MKTKNAKEKKFRQLSDEELEQVNGGAGCFTEDMEVCIRRGGIFNVPECKCSVSVD